MIIILEGVDNSGKSTLATRLAMHLDYVIIPTEGPPKYEGEMDERLERYRVRYATNVIFDRHPVISQSLYGRMRGTGDQFDDKWRKLLKAARPLYIYCDPQGRGLVGHVVNKVDSQAHLKQLYDNYFQLLGYYREWAIANAHIIYRIGDSINDICNFAEVYCKHIRSRLGHGRIP